MNDGNSPIFSAPMQGEPIGSLQYAQGTEMPKRKGPIKLILIILGGLAFIVVAVVLVFNLNKTQASLIIGGWECEDGAFFTFDKSGFFKMHIIDGEDMGEMTGQYDVTKTESFLSDIVPVDKNKTIGLPDYGLSKVSGNTLLLTVPASHLQEVDDTNKTTLVTLTCNKERT